jgi:drug/metabolite transporter (DMT)-like permease
MTPAGDPTATAQRTRSTTLLPALALVSVTAIWGSTFVVIKDLIAEIPVLDFLAVRFGIAALALLLVAPRAVGRLSPQARRRGLGLGLVYGAAQVLQTAGLATVSASVSGFVTGVYVVLTPLLAGWLLRERIPRATWVAVGLATVGLAVLSLQGVAVGLGELLTLLAAALYALHIVGLGAWSRPEDAFGLAIVQMGVIAVVCTLAAAPGGIAVPSTTGGWVAMLYVAIAAGAVAMLAQTWAQAHLTATRAAIIMTMEPVFATLFGVTVDGDPLTARFLLGAGLVLGAMYLAELGPRRGRDGPVPHLPGE